ncbi:MAG TPA: DNA alkylation repair protein [Candidatus Limnocylindrales bacterium]|nr:DNA alkylation repair protein [Candidatus Limnocylindrales bacterium]
MVDQTTPAMRAARLEARLRDVGTPERADGEKRYLKSDLDFLGATVWQIRAEVRAAITDLGTLDHDELVALVDALWSEPIFERRMAASVLLDLRSGLLGTADLALLERLLRDSETWALVDGLAGDVVGSILAADEKGTSRALDRWAADDEFWIRRAALLAWLRPLRAGAPLDRFLAYADAMLDEKEFFIRKAIGWVLREVGKRRPSEVTDWLAPRTHRASGVTMREAVKYLPAADARRLMLAYREKWPAA